MFIFKMIGSEEAAIIKMVSEEIKMGIKNFKSIYCMVN